MEDPRFSKAQILIQQKRFKEAEAILQNLLSQDSDSINVLYMLAEVNIQQEKYDAADALIERAIVNAPYVSYLFFTKSRIAIQKDDYEAAETNIKQALHLDPNDANNFALYANIRMAQKRFEDALDYSNKALAIDPENLLALNLRSRSLVKLDRKEESFVTIEGALREDPNNAYTHANYGWGLLEKNDHKKALEHFKEALKNDPNNDYAKAGMIEAIKATNPIYRLFLKYSFWMSNLTAKYQWGVLIAFYVGFRLLGNLAESSETLGPFLIPIIILLAIFAFSTWIMTPISNLFLRFNPYGQFLLDKNEITSSNFVAASLGVCLLSILLYFVTGNTLWTVVGFFGFAMMVPLGLMFTKTKSKNILLYYTFAMAAIGFIAIAVSFMNGEVFNTFSGIFIFSFIAFQWVTNYFMIKENNV